MVKKNNTSLWCMEGKASRVCFLASCNSLMWLTQSCWALPFCILRISGISLPHIRATERPSSEILLTPSHQNTTRIGYCTRLVTRTSQIKLLGCCIVSVTTVILIEWECRRKDMLHLLDIEMHIPFVWSLGTFDGVLYKAIRITHVDRIQWTSCQSDAESIPLPTLSSAKKDTDLLPPWAAWCACAVHTPKVLSCFFTHNPSLHHRQHAVQVCWAITLPSPRFLGTTI